MISKAMPILNKGPMAGILLMKPVPTLVGRHFQDTYPEHAHFKCTALRLCRLVQDGKTATAGILVGMIFLSPKDGGY